MKVLLLILGLMFLLFALLAGVVAFILACAPMAAMVLFLILGGFLCVWAVEIDKAESGRATGQAAPPAKAEKIGDN